MAKKKEVVIDLKAKAKEIAEVNGVQTVYVNSKGEFFTNKNYALNSEKDKKNVQAFSFENAAEEVDETDETDKVDE
ncbi:MAG: hypothetical protein LBQ74_03870 [Prevotella sp.]|jgi:hypothetical protein|nr:hypothetical protein [Prevotella sp.]